jgi:hypothetical protein
MKPIVTLFLACSLLICAWGCSNSAVKNGSAEKNTADAVPTTDTVDEKQEPGETVSVDDAQQEDSGERASAQDEEVEELVLNIDEEKEAVSIYTVIESLEDCYRTKNYDRWLSYLTQAYRDHFNNPETLASEGWDAGNLEEFFDLLVSVRRKGNIGDLEISRVEFVSDYKAFVYVILGGSEFPEPQHTFIRIGDSWYKGLSTEEA